MALITLLSTIQWKKSPMQPTRTSGGLEGIDFELLLDLSGVGVNGAESYCLCMYAVGIVCITIQKF
jgi:hypothetical protein